MKDAENYYRSILFWFAPHLGQRIVEVGAGLGTFSQVLATCLKNRDLVLLESADNLFPLLQQKFSGNTCVTLVHGYLEDMPASFTADSVVMVNVLEHITEDERTLQAIHRVLRPGGTVLLFVPAFPWLFGTLDESFGHVRRYTKPMLTERLGRAGFRLISLRYFNLPGIIAWFIAGKVLMRWTIRPRDVRFYDKWVVPWTARLERWWTPPLGQSLLAIAGK